MSVSSADPISLSQVGSIFSFPFTDEFRRTERTTAVVVLRACTLG